MLVLKIVKGVIGQKGWETWLQRWTKKEKKEREIVSKANIRKEQEVYG